MWTYHIKTPILLKLNSNSFTFKCIFPTFLLFKNMEDYTFLPKFKNNSDWACNSSLYSKVNRWASERRGVWFLFFHEIFMLKLLKTSSETVQYKRIIKIMKICISMYYYSTTRILIILELSWTISTNKKTFILVLIF